MFIQAGISAKLLKISSLEVPFSFQSIFYQLDRFHTSSLRVFELCRQQLNARQRKYLDSKIVNNST